MFMPLKVSVLPLRVAPASVFWSAVTSVSRALTRDCRAVIVVGSAGVPAAPAVPGAPVEPCAPGAPTAPAAPGAPRWLSVIECLQCDLDVSTLSTPFFAMHTVSDPLVVLAAAAACAVALPASSAAVTTSPQHPVLNPASTGRYERNIATLLDRDRPQALDQPKPRPTLNEPQRY
jgi:hypothetical protein